MKHTVILIIWLALSCLMNVRAQVGIGTMVPDGSAMLDVVSTSKGMLVPRMNTTQRNAISSPATGLIIFNTDIAKFEFFNGSAWAGVGAGGDNLGNHNATMRINLSGNLLSGDGDPEGLFVDVNGNVGIGASGSLPAKLNVHGGNTYGASAAFFNTDAGAEWRTGTSNDGNFKIVKITGSTFPVLTLESSTGNVFLSGDTTRKLGMSRSTGGSGNGHRLVLTAGGAAPGLNDRFGGELIIASGVSTGTGGSDIVLGTATPGVSGNSDNLPSEKMRITAAGNVGIGTNTPTDQLHINTAMSQSGLRLTTASTGTTSTDGLHLSVNSTAANILSYENNNLNLGTAGANVLTISNSQYVGIGVSTPSSVLHIKQAGVAPAVSIQRDDAVNAAGVTISRIDFGDATAGATLQQASIITTRDAVSSGSLDLPTALSFSTIADGSNVLTERMRISNNGYVGIGTAAPQAQLHTTGLVRFVNCSSGVNGAFLRTNTLGVLSAVNFSGNVADVLRGDGSIGPPSGVLTGTGSATRVAFWNSASSLTFNNNLFWDNSNSRLGIGTAAPNQQLELTGNMRIPATTSSTGIIYMGNSPFIHGIGSNNLFAGLNAGNLSISGGYQNVGIGGSAMSAITSGRYNVAVGDAALVSNTTAEQNTAIGFYSLNAVASGNYNTAVGAFALRVNTASGNTAVGKNSLQGNSDGNNNTAIGLNSLSSNTTASTSVAVGSNALAIQSYNNGGSSYNADNVAIGNQSLYYNNPTTPSNGIRNTAIGALSLYNNSTGYYNTALGGYSLLSNTTGYSNTAIGYQADVSTGNLSNATAIGAGSIVSTSNSLVLGASGTNVGIGTSAPATTLHVRRGGTLPTITIQNGDAIVNANTAMDRIDFSDGQGSTDQASIMAIRDNASSGPFDVPTALAFYTTKDGNSSGSEKLRISNEGYLGVGTSAPQDMLSVGGSSQFQVNGVGDLTRIKSVTYSWPNANGTGVLANNGAGGLSWTTLASLGGIVSASNGLTQVGSDVKLGGGLTGATTISQGSFSLTYSYTGTTTTGQTYNANSVTTAAAKVITANGLSTGSALNLSSTSTAGISSKMLAISRSGNNASASATNYGQFTEILNTGSISTNIAAYFSASGATNNYAIVVPYGGGKVGIGTVAPSEMLDIRSTDSDIELYTHSATESSSLHIKRSRGSVAVPTIVQAGDYYGGIGFSGYDGASYLESARIQASVEGTPASGKMPGRLEFWTAPIAGGEAYERMRLTSEGNLGIEITNPNAVLHAVDSAASLTAAVYGQNVYSGNLDRTGVCGSSINNPGYGIGGSFTGGFRGVYAYANATTYTGSAYGVYATATGSVGSRYALYGVANSSSSGTNYGVYGAASNGALNYACYFMGNGYISGNFQIGGTLSKGGGSFKIDHPQDPENKYLIHSFVESPDMMNIYNGNVTTDANGLATITLPSYFEVLNRDFRYQLTTLGVFAQAIIAEKVQGGKFIIKTDKPNIEVSWQVTGIRKDPWAEKNPIIPELEKSSAEKGKYLHPELYGKPESSAIYRNQLPDETESRRNPTKP